MIICHDSHTRREMEKSASVRPFLQNFLAITAHFRIGLEELLASPVLRNWIDTFNEKPNGHYNVPGSNSESSDEAEIANSMEDNTPNAVECDA